MLSFTSTLNRSSRILYFPLRRHSRSPPTHRDGKSLFDVPTLARKTKSTLEQLFCSRYGLFGLRGACAMMTIGITAFLHSSRTFYSEQRFIWALYAIVLSLNETSGSSIQSLCFRFLGTLASMLASYLIWYIFDKHTSGISVLLWIWFGVLGFLCRADWLLVTTNEQNSTRDNRARPKLFAPSCLTPSHILCCIAKAPSFSSSRRSIASSRS